MGKNIQNPPFVACSLATVRTYSTYYVGSSFVLCEKKVVGCA